MGARGREHVNPAWRAETMVADTANVYRMLADRHQPRITDFDARIAAERKPELSEAQSASSHR
jgi:hypothetical protein